MFPLRELPPQPGLCPHTPVVSRRPEEDELIKPESDSSWSLVSRQGCEREAWPAYGKLLQRPC